MKASNISLIKNFAAGNNDSIQGSKLKALFNLIQKKGEPIKTQDEKLNGLMSLKIDQNNFIALKRVGSKKSFFPCAIQAYLLTSI